MKSETGYVGRQGTYLRYVTEERYKQWYGRECRVYARSGREVGRISIFILFSSLFHHLVRFYHILS